MNRFTLKYSVLDRAIALSKYISKTDSTTSLNFKNHKVIQQEN